MHCFALFLISAGLCYLPVLTHPVAEKCCPGKADCCSNVIANKIRLSSCFSELHEEKKAVDCIQTEIFGQKSLQFASFNDIECCSLYTLDGNDIEDQCHKGCLNEFSVPTVSSKDKLSFIRACRADGNREMYTCFRRCQIWKRTVSNIEPFPVHRQCNISAMLHEKVIYLGEEIEPRHITA